MAVRKRPKRVIPMKRASITMPPIGKGEGKVRLRRNTGRPDPAKYRRGMTVDRSTAGYLQVIVNNNKDVTFYRGVPTQVESWEHAEPFGPATASVFFPQVTHFDKIGGLTGKLSWLATGTPLTINFIGKDRKRKAVCFEGIITAQTIVAPDSNGGQPGVQVSCQGTLLAGAQSAVAHQEVIWRHEDIGITVARLLNDVVGRKYSRCRPKETGIFHRSRSAEESVDARVSDLLAQAVQMDEDPENPPKQWTVNQRPGKRPKIVLKDYDTVHWTVYASAPGVDVSATRDVIGSPTSIYGRGEDETSAGGMTWANLKLPGYHPNLKSFANADNPEIEGCEPFPYSSAANTMGPGSTNGSTATGKGVTTLQKRLKELGYKVTVTGSWTDATGDAVLRWQKKKGLKRTGTVGGQTWSSLFFSAEDDTPFKKAFYLPLATRTLSEPYLYYPDGTRKGKNPDYDPTTLRRERVRVFPSGYSKAEAKEILEAELQRDKNPGRTGTITLRSDPLEASRWRVLAGENILVKNWVAGADRLFHIVSVSANPNARPGEMVLTVDTEARDAITVDALEENRENSLNPARRGGRHRKREMAPEKPIVDGELFGRVNAVTQAGEWTVLRVPLGTEGDITRLEFEATNSATPFVVSMFGRNVTPRELDNNIGNPFEFREDGRRPFPGDETTGAWLESKVYINTLGGPGNRAGFWPGEESKGDTFTGVQKDSDVSLHYVSYDPPWVWVAVYTGDTPSKIKGRIYQSADGT